MTGTLIHSMAEFEAIIIDTLVCAGARHIVEIGAEYGGMSQLLAAHAADAGGSLTSIDPAPKPEFVHWADSNPHVRHLAFPSLEIMPQLRAADAWVIDGDHNYYTVYHELMNADRLCRRDRTPLLALLHDVSWPAARRDLYYAPDRIPDEWRHPHCWDSGVTLDSPEIVRHRGFRGMGQFAVATHIGGPRNGVLTAVEDFRATQQAAGRALAWAEIPAVFGLGILFDTDAPWSADLANRLHLYHGNPLIAALEANRLRNYLAVLDWQDGFTGAPSLAAPACADRPTPLPAVPVN